MNSRLVTFCFAWNIVFAVAFKVSMLMGPDRTNLPKISSLIPKVNFNGALQRAHYLSATGFLGGLFASDNSKKNTVAAQGEAQPTNAVIKVVDGIRQKRLGGGDINVSELGLGTQRWVSDDFNAPDEKLCFDFMDRAILKSGVNFIDTAESYPIPSSQKNPEGKVEQVIGKWMAQSPGRRQKVVISTKITGGRNVNRRNIIADVDGSLKRLGTDYIDVYSLHWPARYSPQANWGQSLMYNHEFEKYYESNAGFEEIALAMGDLIKQGKLRGWGLCNDNAFGLTACCEISKRLGIPPPVSMQNDFSLIDRRAEENGVSEASSPIHENVGFMAYNALAGGVLAGTYLNNPPPTYDNNNLASSMATRNAPRGRHDEVGWSRSLYRYRSGPANEATIAYSKLAEQYKIPLVELSLRWTQSRRAVTTTLLGMTSMKQLDQDIEIFQNGNDQKKALPYQLLWDIDRIHMRNRLPIFSSTRVGADWAGEGEIGENIP
jgi:aryl-alcohol dehydrogenase-like predicted oxidoreductase